MYLFIRSDIKTILLPVTAFALIVTPSIRLRGILFVPLWVLVHLLLIDIDNQSLSVEEDANNKPWRPLPSGRLSIWTARIISRALYPACIIFSYISGGSSCAIASAGFTLLVYIYDHLGANEHWLWRNVINAFAYTALETGASLILDTHALHSKYTRLALLMSWIVIVSSVHLQDLQDEIGDRAMGRKTFPILLGQTITRSSVIIFIIIWTIYFPVVWRVSGVFRWYLNVLGGCIAIRVWYLRGKADDEKSYRLYNVWLMSMHLLALVHRFHD